MNKKYRYWTTITEIILGFIGIIIFLYSFATPTFKIQWFIIGCLILILMFQVQKIFRYFYWKHIDKIIDQINEKTK